jgi:hypothetical protein
VIRVTVGLDASNVEVAALYTNVSPSSALAILTSVKLPNEILDDGAKPTVANDLFAGLRETVVAGLLVMTTVVAIIL